MPHYTLFTMSTSTAPSLPSDTPGPSRRPVKRTTKETHPNLPPGLILDAEGKVCKVCNSWQDWGKMMGGGAKKGGGGGEGSKKGKGMGMGAFAAMAAGTSSPSSTTPTKSLQGPKDRAECPADTAALGRSTWTFLHTTAAYYPLSAPLETQRQMTNLLSSLSLLYPCLPCAEDFQDSVRSHPPDVSGRFALSKWLCERHNEVNEKLGKERFGCDWGNLDKRWKDGPSDGSCD